ncbi:lytic transglycosylase domain-containing protein [Acinetobacter bereziniae]|nr:lytic transglycosylase domain-containing protein [Acinetobacter bereziniae]NUG65052.1 lytic transglycosylase domain-containing protein [Acinetobacter bereziniae]NUG69642.1 lytic transglycosylase domain-containing protein [Acinetobacter bereziniae]NUG82397.1 lytic transglycosylase domain-containing protein [Acinetobacter bereziniae]
MKKRMKGSVLSVLGCMSIFSLVPETFAGQIYFYKDQNGTTLLTNRKNNDSSLQKIKVTYYKDSNIHSYSNWGSSESSVLPSYSKSRNAFDSIIRQAAQTHGVSEGLIKAVMHTESGFNSNARSPVGAQGLMQLMPATARRFNVSNSFDPQQNIFGGAKYLSWLLKRFNGNTTLALAAYNAGEGNVDKYGGIPPFRETQDYVKRVTSRLNNLYAGGLNLSTNGNVSTGQIIAQSNNANDLNIPDPAPTINNASSIQPVKYNTRPIIIASDGTYTDAPAGSYSTAHASATARITIGN